MATKTSTIARDVIAVIIVLGAVASLFFNVTQVGSDIIRFLAGTVIGFYFGSGQPAFGKIRLRKAPTAPKE